LRSCVDLQLAVSNHQLGLASLFFHIYHEQLCGGVTSRSARKNEKDEKMGGIFYL